MIRYLARRLVRLLLMVAAWLISFVLSAIAASYLYVAWDLPSVRPLRTPAGIAAVMEPSLGGTTDRARQAYRPVAFTELPPYVVNAFTVSHDAYMRWDLARRLLIDEPRKLSGHVYRAVLDLHLRALLSHEETVAASLNCLYFGNGIYGIEAAARLYFHKGVADVSLDEAAMLAAIVYAPTDLNPGRNPEALHRRRAKVLAIMRDKGLITQEESLFASLMPIYPPIP